MEKIIEIIGIGGFITFLWCLLRIHANNCKLRGQDDILCSLYSFLTKNNEPRRQKSGGKKAGKEQKMTHLRDISDEHELALHREAHSFSRFLLYTIVSVLLIMGICGTMFEVHTVLGNNSSGESPMLEEVLPALGPAKAAVICSIVLLIFKGIYIHCVEDYMQRHGFAAMEELTVQRKKEGRISGDEYEKIASKIQLLHGALSNYTEGCDHELMEMRKELGESRKPSPQWINFSYEMPIITTGAKVGETGLYRTPTELKSGDLLPDTAQVGVPGGAYPAKKLPTQS